MEEQQVAISQQPTPTPSKKFPWKKLTLGLVAFIIVFGGVGSILAWKTTYLDNYLPVGVKEFFGRGEERGEPTGEAIKDWKSWENESFGISLKYPQTYQITNESGIEAGKFGGQLVLSDQTRAGNLELRFYFNFYGGFEGPECANLISYETAIRDGKVEVLSRSVTPPTEEEIKLCAEQFGYTAQERYKVQFAIGAWPEKGSYGPYEEGTKENWILVHFTYGGVDYEPELNQIVKTIKITKEDIYAKKPKEDPTKDWKTYENRELGYELKYPSNWAYAVCESGNAPEEGVLIDTVLLWFGPKTMSLGCGPGTEGAIIVVVNVSKEVPESLYGDIMNALRESKIQFEHKAITLGGLQGEQLICSQQGWIYSGVVRPQSHPYGTKTYARIHGIDLHELKHKEIYDLILTTFKFL